MKCNYLTIEREYGSGGTKIARRLAEESGLPCYGAEILESVSQSIHVPVEQIQKYEESVSNSFLYTLFMMSRADADKSDMLNREGHIYVAEQDEIRRLANQSRGYLFGSLCVRGLKRAQGRGEGVYPGEGRGQKAADHGGLPNPGKQAGKRAQAV